VHLALAPDPTGVGAPPPASYGKRAGRAAAPDADAIARHGSTWSLRLPDAAPGRRVLHVDWAGDVAVLEVDGRVVADRFWDGTPWTVGLDPLGLTPDAELTVRIVPLHPGANVRLPDEAEARRRAVDSSLVALDGVRLVSSPLWHEVPTAD